MSVAIENTFSFFIVGIVVLLCLGVCIGECKNIHDRHDDEDLIEYPPTDLIIDLSSIYIQPDLVLNPFFYDDISHSIV